MLLLLACSPPAELLTPDGPSFGHFLASVRYPDEVKAVTVGGVATYDLQQSGDLVEFIVQGGSSGMAEVVVLNADDEEVLAGELEYLPAVEPLFDSIAGIGASLTMGVQDGVPTFEAQLMSPGAQLARQAGGDFGIPLLVRGLFPTIEPEHLGPPPDCEAPGVVQHVTDSVIQVLGMLNDEHGDFHYSLGRVDPDRVPLNAAVGGYRVQALTEGTDGFELGFIGHLVLDPYGGLDGRIPFSQVDHVLEQEPTLVLSFDTFGNDLIGAVVLADEIELDNITSEEDFQFGVERLMELLAGSDAEIFLANTPRPGLLPAGRLLVETAEDPEEAQALLDEADALAVDYNAILAAEADRYDNIHVVDAWTYAEQLDVEGLEVGGQYLDVSRFGGLLSLDGVHFTDTGYATFANLFIEAIEAELGVVLDPIDIEAVIAADHRSPQALADAGVDLDACWR